MKYLKRIGVVIFIPISFIVLLICLLLYFTVVFPLLWWVFTGDSDYTIIVTNKITNIFTYLTH